MRSVMLAAIAGVTRRDICTQQKLYHAKCRAQAAFKCNSFLEKAFVNRVNRRSCIRIVRFCLSMCDVEIRLGLGFPVTGIGSAWTNSPGLYRVSGAPNASSTATLHPE